MAEFTITGKRNGKRISITWRDGQLSGDRATVLWIKQLAQGYEGTIQGLPGAPATVTRHLSSPYTACALIRSVFPGAVEQDQSLPPLSIPPGAIS